MTNPRCRLLEWDTGFFGFPIARVTDSRLRREEVPAVLDWCAAERIRCLYLLSASDDAETAAAAAEYRFSFVDIRTTLERMAADPPPHAGCIRPAAERDIPSLAAIARVSHGDSRFYHDPGFPRERCDALYATWIEKSCRGGAQAVLVAERDSRPAGYIACNWAGGAGQIGLIAVAGWARGAGLGRALVTSSLGVFQQNGVSRISVVTQGRNVASQRLYQRCGFLTCSVQIWYHRWFPPQ